MKGSPSNLSACLKGLGVNPSSFIAVINQSIRKNTEGLKGFRMKDINSMPNSSRPKKYSSRPKKYSLSAKKYTL